MAIEKSIWPQGRIRSRSTDCPADETMPTVFVVDPDVSVRESLESIIRSEGWRAETFASANQFLSSVRDIAASCLVLDVDLPDLSGLELQERVALEIGMPVIFIAAAADIRTTVHAMKAGAIEFLTKPYCPGALLTAIRLAIERSRAAMHHASEMRTLREDYARLSARERQVMALVVLGRLNKQVAAELDISEITVKAHRGRLMMKMRADSLAVLVRMASRLENAPTPMHHAWTSKSSTTTWEPSV